MEMNEFRKGSPVMRGLYGMLACAAFCGAAAAITLSTEKVAIVDMERLQQEAPDIAQIRSELSSELDIHKSHLKDLRKTVVEEQLAITSLETQLAQAEAKRSAPKIIIDTATTAAVAAATAPVPAASSAAVTHVALPGFTTAEALAPMINTPAAPALPAQEPPKTPPALDEKKFEVISTTRVASEIQSRREAIKKAEAQIPAVETQIARIEQEIEEKVKMNLYGRLYDSIRSVADAEGITVVLDQSNVIYGERGEDLTDRVLVFMKKRGGRP